MATKINVNKPAPKPVVLHTKLEFVVHIPEGVVVSDDDYYGEARYVAGDQLYFHLDSDAIPALLTLLEEFKAAALDTVKL